MPQKMTKILVGLLLASFITVLPGCVGGKKVVPSSKSSRNYAVVKARAGDSPKSLANRYLKDPDKNWVIESYNNTETLTAGHLYVVPLQPQNRGGMTAKGYQTVPVLAYSGFSETTSDGVTISRKDFEAQMAYIKEQGYTPVTIENLFDFMEVNDSLPEKAVVITIDDMGRGTYSVAYPVLKKFGFKAAIFICTDFVTGKGESLSWDQVRQLKSEGFTIGNRSKTLRNLTRRQPDETFEDFYISVDRELTVSTLKFRHELQDKPQFFAYPYGAVNELVISLLQKNNFRGAFTMQKGTNPFFADSFLVKRNAISGTMSQKDFASQFTFFVEEDLQ